MGGGKASGRRGSRAIRKRVASVQNNCGRIRRREDLLQKQSEDVRFRGKARSRIVHLSVFFQTEEEPAKLI